MEGKIVIALSLDEFRACFREMDRDYYSYEGYEFLYNYYLEYSEAIGTPFEVDIVAICIDWTEYISLAAAEAEYGDMSQVNSYTELSNGNVMVME